MSEEALLQEAGDEKDPVLVRAANAIWDFFFICCTPERAQGYAFIGTIIDYN